MKAITVKPRYSPIRLSKNNYLYCKLMKEVVSLGDKILRSEQEKIAKQIGDKICTK